MRSAGVTAPPQSAAAATSDGQQLGFGNGSMSVSVARIE